MRLNNVWKEGDVLNPINFKCCPTSTSHYRFNKLCTKRCMWGSMWKGPPPKLHFLNTPTEYIQTKYCIKLYKNTGTNILVSPLLLGLRMMKYLLLKIIWLCLVITYNLSFCQFLCCITKFRLAEPLMVTRAWGILTFCSASQKTYTILICL